MVKRVQTEKGFEDVGKELIGYTHEHLVGLLHATPGVDVPSPEAAQAALNVKHQRVMVKLYMTLAWLKWVIAAAAIAQIGVMIWATLKAAK